MPREIKLLPPDHPIFSGGVSFVFRSDLPADLADTLERLRRRGLR